jgi:hypothetical protein
MAFLFANTGVDYIAKCALNKASPSDFIVHLFTNNHTPAVTDSAANYTECALSGYASITLSAGTWSGGASGGVATYVYSALGYTFAAYAGGTTIFGAYVTTVSGVFIGAELISPSYAVPSGGGTLNYTPTYQEA